jgi:hypothetical protein
MNENISYDTLDLLIGDLKSEKELLTILNFLENVKTIIRHLYWSQRLKNDLEEDQKFLGYLRINSFDTHIIHAECLI